MHLERPMLGIAQHQVRYLAVCVGIIPPIATLNDRVVCIDLRCCVCAGGQMTSSASDHRSRTYEVL